MGFSRVDGATALVRAEASSPLQIIAPRPRGASAWAFLIGHGGGLVAGDRIEVEVEVGGGAAALLATQAETKVYRAIAGDGASQRITSRIARDGVLALLPEPISPFAGARYAQRQTFFLEAGASLLAVDAVASGRAARGERWRFDHYHSVNEIFSSGRRVLGDALRLGDAAGSPALGARRSATLAQRLGRFEVFATAFALGPAFTQGASALRARLAHGPIAPGAPVWTAASPLADGVFLRCAGQSTEALELFLREALAFAAEPLGADPFSHRW